MREMLACHRADVQKLLQGNTSRKAILGAHLTNRGLHALILYRFSRLCLSKRIPLLPLIMTRIAQILYAIDISPRANLGPGIVIVHGVGVVIGAEVQIDGDCCIYHGVTLGDRGSEWVRSKRADGHPSLERGIMIGAGAKILGPIHIGANSIIGANAVVLQDIPPNSIVAGVPARVIRQLPPEEDEATIEGTSTEHSG